MNTSKTCIQCGTAVAVDAPGGMCAACLLKPGMGPRGSGDVFQTTPFEHHFTAPTIAELAPHFPDLEIVQLLGQGGNGSCLPGTPDPS